MKLSDDLHLNEVDCVRLLVSANQEVWSICYSYFSVTYTAYYHILTEFMFLNFLLFLVRSDGPRSYRNLTSCIWTLVHWETRSNNSSLYTIQSRFLSVTLSTILVQYSFSWPFINLCQELLLWYFCRLLCLIRDLKKILWLTFRSIWKILLTQGLGSGWFPLWRFEPIWCSLLRYAL